jgi:hypothetical protein
MAKNNNRSESYRIFKKFNLRILIALFVLFVCLSIYGLRQNNINMINLKNQLMTADKDNGNVNGDLNKLRTYIYNHMNTSPSSSDGIYPPIQLKYTYQRLLAQAQSAITTQNTAQYNQAVAYCNSIEPNATADEDSLRQLATCEEQHYIAQPLASAYVSPALYEFDFISPLWSPDLAGYSILISIALLIAIAAIFILEKFIN